jgi:hypothetical protein
MAVTVDRARPLVVTLATTLKRVDGYTVGGATVLWITAPETEDVLVVSDGASVDGGALPANYHRIPANTSQPYEIRSDPILIAGSSGGGNATIRVV